MNKDDIKNRNVASSGKYVCIDCWLHAESTIEELHEIPGEGYCKHFRPEWWETKGWTRNWGDAAVMAWPLLEILRKEDAEGCEFLILCPKLRRPVIIICRDPNAWGSF